MGSKLERPHEFLQGYQSGHLVHRVLFSSSSWEEAHSQHHHSFVCFLGGQGVGELVAAPQWGPLVYETEHPNRLCINT